MSWKQYGGAKHLDMNRKITTNTVVADEIILKSSYIGGFTIHGVLDVTGKGTIQGGLDVSGYITVNDISSSVIYTDTLYTSNSATIKGDLNANKNLLVGKNAIIGNDITILNNSHIGNILYLNKNDSQFIYSDGSGIGINQLSPNATLDISSNLVRSLNIYSSQNMNRNIIAQNNIHKGIVVTADLTSSRIDFFTNKTISDINNSDAFIQCISGGVLEIDVTNNTRIASKLSVTTRGDTTHPYNETVVIYDISTGIYKPEIYHNAQAHTGDALTLISDDSESTTFLRIVTPNKDGIGIAGGSYTLNTDRTMGIIGLFNINGEFTQNQTIVSSTDPVKYKTTTGINTYQPKTEKYVLDINGPVSINNGDITNVAIANFKINKITASPKGDLVIAVGYSSNILDSTYGYSRYIISRDYGSTWLERLFMSADDSRTNIFTNSTVYKYDINDIVIYDNSYVFISYKDIINSNPKLVYSIDGGNYWSSVTFPINANNNRTYNFNKITIKPNSFTFPNFIIYISETTNNIDANFYTVTIDISNNNGSFPPFSQLSGNLINSFDYYSFNDSFYFSTNNGIYSKYGINNFSLLIDSSMNQFNNIRCISNNIIAVGNGIIAKSINGTDFIYFSYPNQIFTSIYGFNNYIFTIGNTNTIWFSNDYGISFNTLWNNNSFENISQSGTQYLITDPSNILSNIIMTDSNTILLSNIKDPSSTSIINCYLPNLCNRVNNYVLDICGNMRISGDIYVNDSGKIISNNSEFYLINENVNKLHFAEGASSVSISNITGNTTINNNLVVKLDSTYSGNTLTYGIGKIVNTTDSSSISTGAFIINGGLGISKTTNIGGNLFVNKDSLLTGKLNVMLDTSLNGNLFVYSLKDSVNPSTGAVVISGGVGIKGNLNILGKTNLSNTLNVTSDTTLNGNVVISSTTSSINPSTGSVIISGGVGIQGNVNILKHTIIGGNINMVNENTLAQFNSLNVLSILDSSSVNSGSVIISGGAGISKSLNIGGSLSVNKESVFSENVNINNNLSTQGNIYVENGIFSQKDISTNGNIYINSNTISTGSSTGALVIFGGVGISQNLNIGGNSNIQQNLTVNNSIIGNTATINSIYSNGILNIASIDDVSTNEINIGSKSMSSGIKIGRNTQYINIGSNDKTQGLNPSIYIGNPGSTITTSNAATIKIGGNNDIIDIQGSEIKIGGATIFKSSDTSAKQFSQLIQYSNNVILNYDNSGNGQVGPLNYPARGAGLWINDLSINNLGQFIVTRDVQGFLFKAPTYESTNDYYADLALNPSLPKQNIVRFDVNKMVTTAPIGGLVILSKLTGDADNCRYSVTGSNIDISNVFTKNTDNTITGTLNSTATANFNNVSITGSSFVNKLSIGTGTSLNTNSLDISGNISQTLGGYIYQF